MLIGFLRCKGTGNFQAVSEIASSRKNPLAAGRGGFLCYLVND